MMRLTTCSFILILVILLTVHDVPSISWPLIISSQTLTAMVTRILVLESLTTLKLAILRYLALNFGLIWNGFIDNTLSVSLLILIRRLAAVPEIMHLVLVSTRHYVGLSGIVVINIFLTNVVHHLLVKDISSCILSSTAGHDWNVATFDALYSISKLPVVLFVAVIQPLHFV